MNLSPKNNNNQVSDEAAHDLLKSESMLSNLIRESRKMQDRSTVLSNHRESIKKDMVKELDKLE